MLIMESEADYYVNPYLKRSRTTEWRRRKKRRSETVSTSTDDVEDRLFRDFQASGSPSESSSVSENIINSSASSSASMVYHAPSSSTTQSSRSSLNEDFHHEILPEPPGEGESSDDASIELSTDDDSEEDDRLYREVMNGGSNDEADEDESFHNLKHILESDENVEITVTVNKADLLLAGLKYASDYDLCNTALADLYKLINSTLQRKLLPETRYLVDQIFNSSNGAQYHAVCPNTDCNSYVGEFDRTDRELLCDVCGQLINLKSPCYFSFFAIFNVENECSNLIQNNIDHINSVIERRSQEHETMSDFCDGNLYKEFLRSQPPDQRNNYVTATFNCDGAPVFESSKYSIHPIQMIINELPYDVRTAKPVTCGMWFGRKPDMNVYLPPYVNMMNDLSNNGVSYQVGNEIRRMKIHTLCCCVDSVARAPMQGITQYNGYFGCSWCLHPGVYVPTVRGGCVKYVLLDELPPRRTQLEMYRHMQLSLESNVPVFGVKRPSALINMNNLNIISAFTPDKLHCAGEGVGPQLTSYWIDSHDMPFSLSNDDVAVVERLLLAIKAPNLITRLSRGIVDRSWWKAREWENWIIFYSVPILLRFPHMQIFMRHWSLYVEALYINDKDGVTPAELQHAHGLFLQFIAETELRYTQHAMTSNVHQSEHITQSTVDWGPMYNHSGHCFESGNGRLLKKIHAANGVLFQLCRSISMTQGEVLLRQHSRDKPITALQSYVSYLDNKNAALSLRGEVARYFGPYSKTKKKWIRDLQLSRFSRTYLKFTKGGCLYTSYRRKRLRSNNSYAITEGGTYVKLRDFIYDEETLSEYVLCKTVIVENVLRDTFPIKRILEISNNVLAIETAQIEKICVFVSNDNNEYLCAVPNMHHY